MWASVLRLCESLYLSFFSLLTMFETLLFSTWPPVSLESCQLCPLFCCVVRLMLLYMPCQYVRNL